MKKFRKIKGYKKFDTYDIFDNKGSFVAYFRMYKGSKIMGIVKIQ